MLCHRNTRFKHGREIGGLLACETEVGTAEAVERQHRARAALVPGGRQTLGKPFKALAGDVRHQSIPVAKVAVRRRRADTGLPGRFGKGETGGALLREEVTSSAGQRVAKVAVVVAAPSAAALSGPAHEEGLAHSAPGDINWQREA